MFPYPDQFAKILLLKIAKLLKFYHTAGWAIGNASILQPAACSLQSAVGSRQSAVTPVGPNLHLASPIHHHTL